MTTIRVGDVRFALDDFVVARTGVLGITKSGKTYLTKGIVEQLLDHRVPVIVFDAIGVWHTLKNPSRAANGKGYPIVVAGGEHPDLPLTPEGAPEIVRAAIRENISLVIDLYSAKLSKADWRRIVQACSRTLLYENVGRRVIVLEEAAEYAPQKIIDGVTYAEVEKLARMGGNKGLGVVFINQRAQELNKAVLELCDNLVLMRQRGSHAIDALEKWLDRTSPDMAREIAKSMPHLQAGDCWVWTEDSEVPVRTTSLPLRSFHPDRRTHGKITGGRAAVDTEPFVARMHGELTALIAKANADDPEALRREIAQLKRETQQHRCATTAAKVSTVKVPVWTAHDRKIAKLLLGALTGHQKALSALGAAMQCAPELIVATMRATVPTPVPPERPVAPVLALSRNGGEVRHRGSGFELTLDVGAPRDPKIGAGGLYRILLALARRPQGLALGALGMRAKLKAKNSGTFDTYISRARQAGWLTSDGGIYRITEAGVRALGPFDPEPMGDELRNYWRHKLGNSGAARMLDVLVKCFPHAVPVETLIAEAGLSPGGTADTYISRLRTLELTTRQPDGLIRASSELFSS